MRHWTTIAVTLVLATFAVWSLSAKGATQGNPPVIYDRVAPLENALREAIVHIQKLEENAKTQDQTIETLKKMAIDHEGKIKKLEDRLTKAEKTIKELADKGK